MLLMISIVSVGLVVLIWLAGEVDKLDVRVKKLERTTIQLKQKTEPNDHDMKREVLRTKL